MFVRVGVVWLGVVCVYGVDCERGGGVWSGGVGVVIVCVGVGVFVVVCGWLVVCVCVCVCVGVSVFVCGCVWEGEQTQLQGVWRGGGEGG